MEREGQGSWLGNGHSLAQAVDEESKLECPGGQSRHWGGTGRSCSLPCFSRHTWVGVVKGTEEDPGVQPGGGWFHDRRLTLTQRTHVVYLGVC